jgi:hypothetical protein
MEMTFDGFKAVIQSQLGIRPGCGGTQFPWAKVQDAHQNQDT